MSKQVMNLRKESQSEKKHLIDEWKVRREKVNQRKKLEVVITQENEKMQKAMVNLIKPICEKAGFGIHLRIKDTKIEISTQIIKVISEEKIIRARLSIEDIKLEYWLDEEKHIDFRLRDLEIKMRYFKKIMANSNVSLTPKNQITIGIETRNRYF